jgi:hypothetical protein
MKIGLIDADNIGSKTRFPNLAIMKLSAYHKSHGDTVEWWSMYEKYDIVYGSKVFDFTAPMPSITNSKEVHIGGCAVDLENKLPTDVEHMCPDYSIYDTDTSYGFLTRGCPRNCSFCNVTQHQGSIAIKVADLSEFWNGQKEIVLLDPNMYASKDWKDCHNQLERSGAKIDFSQGVDIRVMTDEKVEALNRLNVKMLHFAWDNYEFSTYKKLKELRGKFKFSGRNMRVYVLTNFNTTHEQDLERIMKLRELDYDPYVMIYDKSSAPKITKRVQRWVNNKYIWRSTPTFAEYGKLKPSEMTGQQNLF